MNRRRALCVVGNAALATVNGKKDLLFDVGGEPKTDLTVTVQALRSGSWVNRLGLNYKDKPGTHTAAFVGT